MATPNSTATAAALTETNEEALLDYELDCPLEEEFMCRICAPMPKKYKRHGDLSKHIRRYHLHRLVFKCRGCETVF